MKTACDNRWKKIFSALLAVFSLVSAFGQEEDTFSLGGLTEANANTRHGFAAAGGALFDYGFTDNFAAGIKLDYGSDFHDVSSMEALAFARYYFFRYAPFNFFFQAGAGYIGLFEDSRMVSTVLADGGLGFRIPIHRFFTEHYIRFGWPTGFGFGLALGYRFGANPPLPPPEPVRRPPARIVEEPQPPSSQIAEEPPPPSPQIAEEPPPEAAPHTDGISYTDEGLITDPQILFLPNLRDFTVPDNAPNRPMQLQIVEANRIGLRRIADFMKSHPEQTLHIEGHANPVLGTPEEETVRLIPLSGLRAQFIRTQLIELGVEEWRLGASGAGGRDAGKTGVWENRRVRFYLSAPPGKHR
jgi:hypothetical protein